MKKVIIIILLLTSLAFSQDKPYRLLNSFSAGELSELLKAREDLSKYHSGCSVMENMIPLPQGGAQKRPGTVYVAESKSNTKIRLLPFEYSTEQSYIIELGNQYARFYTSNAQILSGDGSEDLSALDNILAHWMLNDDASNTTVLDDDGNDHDGTATSNTDTLSETGKVGTGCFDLNAADSVKVTDHADFTFVEGVDGDFSIAAWAYVTKDDTVILSKWDTNAKREWRLYISYGLKLVLQLADQSATAYPYRRTDSGLTTGWHFIVATYSGDDGSWTGATAANFIILYVDGEVAASTATNDASYVKMEDLTGDVGIGCTYATGTPTTEWDDKIDEVSMYSDILTPAEIAALYTSAAYEIVTPYLTADLFELKYEQSADVLFITHPDYETRKLSRFANAAWTLEHLGISNGPFRTQNEDVTNTISASATTGSVTLTATGCSPFIYGTTAGHEPSGATKKSKSRTGALFKMVHPLGTLQYGTKLEDNYTNDQTEDVSWMDCGTVYKGTTWYLETQGTWTGTLNIQRNYTIGAAHDASGWEDAMPPYKGNDNRNAATNSTEEFNDASYRAILTASGDAAEECRVYFWTDATDHIGVVKITAVASATSATATVLTTLGSTNATHKWSEGCWSNYRGWPRTVAFFEDRLTFGGNASQPDTIWASVTADYENMLEGADDDDALLFTLSSRMVNVIEWLIGKDKILIGTSGAEWTLSGSSDEPLTPSNVKAEQHSTYGSADLQVTQVSESILFFQRGAEKMRELAYNWELDSYVAPDMTILSPDITGDGITDTAFQQTPNPIFWCIKENGDIAIFVYERKELITSWARFITDDDFESVAAINEDPEDEVWVSVKRTIGGTDKRYIEYFSTMDWGSDPCDAFYVDSGITYDSTATTTITGLGHLEGETVSVLGDGAVLGDEVVSGSQITIDSSCSTVQAGLPYEVQLKTMPLSWIASGMTIQGRIKRINEVIASYYDSGDFYIGRDVDNKELVSITGVDTSDQIKTFPAGYDRPGYVFVYQQSPEPLTLIALMVEFMVY